MASNSGSDNSNGSRSQINTPSSSTPYFTIELDEEFSREENNFDEDHESSSEPEADEELSSEEKDEEEDEDDDIPLVFKRRKTSSTCIELATLTDLNVLDCPICYASLNSPVYQCTNGHIACSPCCTKMANKCPACRLPIGTIRCRAIEKVLESVKVKCRNTLYGCTQTFTNNKKLDHERKCAYPPCSCPYDDCTYTGTPNNLYNHFGLTHPRYKFSFDTMKPISLAATQTQVFLQDSIQSTLFVLKRTIKFPGSFLSVTCVARDSQRGAFSYDLTVVIEKDTKMKIEAVVACESKWTGTSGKCLVLPGDLVQDSAPLKMELIIRNNPLVPLFRSCFNYSI